MRAKVCYIKDNTDIVKFGIHNAANLTTRLMLEGVHQEANFRTPYKEGTLRAKVSKTMDGNTGTIAWRVVYAQYQERGKRKDGTHVVRHYTTAGTGAHFAQDAINTVRKNLLNYAIQGGIKR